MTDQDWHKQVDLYLFRIQQQDKRALQALYDLTSAKILGLITRITNDRHEAEDILQEVYIKIWQQAQQYHGSGSAWGWLCVLSRHCAIDRIRQWKKSRYESTDELPEFLEALTDSTELSNKHWIGQCLKKLKPKPRKAILLSCLKGYTHSELTVKLEAPLGTVKAWLRRGMQELQQCLAA
ncbi:MAG: sigma-70 family RNA polymerase sigma factor [Pseudomonadota bacterium]